MFAGCAYTDDVDTSELGTESSEASGASSGKTLQAPVPNVPVATIDVGRGRKVEFYAYDNGVSFLSETGPAGEASALDELDPAVDQSNYIELHRALRPDLKIPDVIVSVQARRQADPENRKHVQLVRSTAPEEVSDKRPIDKTPILSLADDTTCGNGCCWQPWVLDSMCWKGLQLWDYEPDRLYSHQSASGLGYYEDRSCSARGTSVYTGHECAGGISNGCMEVYLPIAEATWRGLRGGCSGWTCSIKAAHFDHYVNSSSDMHQHTRCIRLSSW
jgi:hypothetical protein